MGHTSDFPGEKLLIKLFESFQQGVGGILRPRQIRRKGRARTDVIEERRLRLAGIEKVEKDIREGRAELVNGKLVMLPSPKSEKDTLGPRSAESGRDVEFFLQASGLEADNLAFRRSLNLARIELLAHEEAQRVPDEEVSDDPLDPDWFARWREAAQDVSNEEMQQLWAKLLAGEVKSPGHFSLQTVNLLRNLSKEQAGWIAALGPFSFGGWIYKNCGQILEKHGITLNVLWELEALGVLGAVDSIGGLLQDIDMSKVVENQARGMILRGSVGLLFIHDSPAKNLQFPAFKIIRAGEELISLGNFQLNVEYLKEIASFARAKGYKTFLAEFEPVPGEPNQRRITRTIELTDEKKDGGYPIADF